MQSSKMGEELITSSENILGGSPRLDKRRLDVRHVIWGITEFDHQKINSYQDHFGVTIDQIRHSIMYCKDQICEFQKVLQSCNGCSKKFRKDIKNSLMDIQDVDNWIIAGRLYKELKEKLNLPNSYQEIVSEIKD